MPSNEMSGDEVLLVTCYGEQFRLVPERCVKNLVSGADRLFLFAIGCRSNNGRIRNKLCNP